MSKASPYGERIRNGKRNSGDRHGGRRPHSLNQQLTASITYPHQRTAESRIARIRTQAWKRQIVSLDREGAVSLNYHAGIAFESSSDGPILAIGTGFDEFYEKHTPAIRYIKETEADEEFDREMEQEARKRGL